MIQWNIDKRGGSPLFLLPRAYHAKRMKKKRFRKSYFQYLHQFFIEKSDRIALKMRDYPR